MRGFTQNRQIGTALPLPVMNRIRRQNGGSARGYLAVGEASQQSRYGLLDGRLFCIYSGASPQPDKACM